MEGHQRIPMGVRSYGIRLHQSLSPRQLAATHRGTPFHDKYLCLRPAHHHCYLHRDTSEIERYTAFHLLPILIFSLKDLELKPFLPIFANE